MPSASRYRVLLWDFDGTLADTFDCVVRVFNATAVEQGYRPVEDTKSLRHLSLAAFLRHTGVPLFKLPFFVRRVLKDMRAEMGGIPLFPQLPAVLRTLHLTGTRMSILSSNSDTNIRTCLKANGVEDLFESVVGYQRLLGKGRGIRRFLRHRGLASRDVLYIGDEVRDVEAARQAGVDVAAVTWGFQAAELLLDANPDYLIARPDQLLALAA